MSVNDFMRRDWDQRARKDPFFYIASWRKDWDQESFFESGEEDYQRLVAPALSRCQFSTQGKVMLELGCGAGRMTWSFARRFERVHAFDISAEMLSRAKTLLNGTDKILWIQGNGSDLAGLGTDSVDFVFSYLVLQHLPTERLAQQYIREMLRVLNQGGIFLFQFNSGRTPTMNWKGQVAWGVVDALWALRLKRVSRSVAASLGFDAEMAGRTWRGAPVDVGRVLEAVRVAGGMVRELTGANTPMTWCCGVKAAHSNP